MHVHLSDLTCTNAVEYLHYELLWDSSKCPHSISTVQEDVLTTLDEQLVGMWSTYCWVSSLTPYSHSVLTAKDVQVALITSDIFKPNWSIYSPVSMHALDSMVLSYSGSLPTAPFELLKFDLRYS